MMHPPKEKTFTCFLISLLCLLSFAGKNYAFETFEYIHAEVITRQGTVIDVEVADDDPKRQQGLSFRKNLPADKGMLFVFDEQKEHSFWMKDMFISIDIIWLNNHRIVHIEHSVPPPGPQERPGTINPGKKANFVLELAEGRAKELGLQVGQTVKYRF